MTSILQIKFLNDRAKFIYQNGDLLSYQTTGSSGFDVRAISILSKIGENPILLENNSFFLKPHHRVCVQLGFSMKIEKEFEMQIRPRSGLAMKNGIMIVNTPGTIDSDYRGEVGALIYNSSNEIFEISEGLRIAQAIICPIIKPIINVVDNLEDSERGDGGFGSTGTK